MGDVTSTLENCTVLGNVFGAGYSATIPTAKVFPGGSAGLFNPIPKYNEKIGVFEPGTFPTPVYYKWSSKGENSNTGSLVDDEEGHWIHTDEDLNTLGSVKGDVTITLSGSTIVGTPGDSQTGNVYGGGDESAVIKNDSGEKGNTTVILEEGTHVLGNVYGGGNEGPVGGNSEVKIQNQSKK